MIDGTKLGVAGDAGRRCSSCRARSWRSFSISASARSRTRRSSSTGMVGAPTRVENIMTEWLGLPALAAAQRRADRRLDRLVHVFMLVLFVGWGAFFLYCAVPLPPTRNPVADYAGAGRTRRAISRSPSRWSRRLLVGSRFRVGGAGRRLPSRRERSAAVVRVTASSSPGTSTIPGPDGPSAGPTSSCSTSDKPAGARSVRSGGEGRHHDDQPAEPAGEQADHRAALEQGRHPQLRAARDAREAGRHSRA